MTGMRIELMALLRETTELRRETRVGFNAIATATDTNSSQIVDAVSAFNIRPYQLTDETATVILDASGNGTAMITPGASTVGGGAGAGKYSGLTWDVIGVAVNVAPVPPATAPVLQAHCSTFLSYGVQSATPYDFHANTVTGSTGDIDTLITTIQPGDWITCIWTGGDSGAIATMRILGTVNPPGTRPLYVRND
jgi:hypothetical protein